ncbi:unnamed protein product [Lampetra fluviatilis]
MALAPPRFHLSGMFIRPRDFSNSPKALSGGGWREGSLGFLVFFHDPAELATAEVGSGGAPQREQASAAPRGPPLHVFTSDVKNDVQNKRFNPNVAHLLALTLLLLLDGLQVRRRRRRSGRSTGSTARTNPRTVGFWFWDRICFRHSNPAGPGGAAQNIRLKKDPRAPNNPGRRCEGEEVSPTRSGEGSAGMPRVKRTNGGGGGGAGVVTAQK